MSRLAKSRRMSLGEAAEIYGITQATLRRRINDGSLPAFRLGTRVIRVEEADVAALFEPVQSATTR